MHVRMLQKALFGNGILQVQQLCSHHVIHRNVACGMRAQSVHHTFIETEDIDVRKRSDTYPVAITAKATDDMKMPVRAKLLALFFVQQSHQKTERPALSP